MENSKILVYVLHGAWGTQEEDSQEILGVSAETQSLEEKLEQIAKSKAKDYVGEPYGETIEDQTDRSYTLSDSIGEYANFYITEHEVKLPVHIMGEISRDMEKIDRMTDIEGYLHDLWENDNIENWKYEYMYNCVEVKQAILQRFEDTEDSNIPFNTTLSEAVEEKKKAIQLNDEVLQFLWQRLGDIPVDDDGITEEDFIDYPAGTDREEIWKRFDEHHSAGVAALMNMEG